MSKVCTYNNKKWIKWEVEEKSSKRSEAVSSSLGKSHCTVPCSTQESHNFIPVSQRYPPMCKQISKYTLHTFGLSCTKLLYLEINTPMEEQKETAQKLSGHLRLYTGGSRITEKAIWSIVPVLVVDWAFSFQNATSLSHSLFREREKTKWNS